MDQPSENRARKVRLNIEELTLAFQTVAAGDDYGDPVPDPYVDLDTGEIIWCEEDESDEFDAPRYLLIDERITDEATYEDMEEFIESVTDESLRLRLQASIEGRGAFRKFKDIVLGGGHIELKHAWHWHTERKVRQRIVEWLELNGVEPQWDHDIFAVPVLPDKRPKLLAAVAEFVAEVAGSPGVRRIALLGSLTTEKRIPKDVDLLVEVEDDADLAGIAQAKRRLLGKTMATGDGCGADVFICDKDSLYIGRACSWKRCEPGVRQSCEAQHCGRRHYLYDDLHVVKLDPERVKAPPVELWPNVVTRTELPDDVRALLLDTLQD